jgi:hypothetical protein
MIIIHLDGDVIGQSKNLRGINDRCRKMPGAKAWIYPTQDGITVVDVSWPDRSYALVSFNSRQLALKYASTKRFQRAAV